MSYVIVKSDRIYCGGKGYAGPSCDIANVEPGKIYRYFSDALKDAESLTNVNGVGWTIHVFSAKKEFVAKL
jgi:hypothetical protein